MDLTGHIGDIITAAKEQRKSPNVNKLWLNKTIARLEEAQVFSEKVYDGRVLGIPTADGSRVNSMPINGSRACTCPEGAIDSNCSVHGSE